MERDSAGSIESFFCSLQSEPSPRNLSQIFEDDLLPMQRESRNLRYQPGGHRAQQPQKSQPEPQLPPTTNPEVSSESVAVVEKTPSRWSVAFAKIVNIYNGYHPVERMGLALSMLGENEAATMILYKQKTQTISNTKLKPNGKVIHLQDNYVQFYDDNRKYWSLRFVHQADEEEFIHTMTTNDWPLEQHSSRSEDDVELQQQQEKEHISRSQDDGEQHTSKSQDDVVHPEQSTEQLRHQTEKLLSDNNSEEWNERMEQKRQQLKEQLRNQLMEELKEEQIERNERCRKLHSEQNREQSREQLREQNREQQDVRNREQRVEQIREQLRQETRELLREQNLEQLRNQNRKQLRENPAEHHEPRRHTCHHHRHSRNNEEHQEAPPQPMPRSRNQGTSQEEHNERCSTYMECLRRHFMHLGCEHMQPAQEQVPEEDLGCEHMQSVREQISEEDLSSERMHSVREQISEEDVIVTPMSIPIGSTSSRTSREHHRSSSTAVVQLPARKDEPTTSSLLTKFVNTHMGPGEIAELKMQNILDAMQRVSGGHRRDFNHNQDEDAPQPQPRLSKAEDAEDRVLQLEQILLNAKKENRRLSKELKMRDEDLISFQRSSLALMEKLITNNEDLTAKNSRLVETIVSKTKESKQDNCIKCERSAQEIVFLKRHINALEVALRESD